MSGIEYKEVKFEPDAVICKVLQDFCPDKYPDELCEGNVIWEFNGEKPDGIFFTFNGYSIVPEENKLGALLKQALLDYIEETKRQAIINVAIGVSRLKSIDVEADVIYLDNPWLDILGTTLFGCDIEAIGFSGNDNFPTALVGSKKLGMYSIIPGLL